MTTLTGSDPKGSDPTRSDPAREVLLTQQETDEDRILNLSLRPQSLEEFIGQPELMENLKVAIEAAQQRGEPLEHLLLSGPQGLGKCIATDSLLFTSEGIVPIGSLGDLQKTGAQDRSLPVYAMDGLEQATHFYNNGPSPTIRIRTHQGYELEGTSNHPIIIVGPDGRMQFKQLQDLWVGAHVAIGRGQNCFGRSTVLPEFSFHSFPMNSWKYDKVRLPSEASPEFGRLCGYLIGDGYIGHTGEITFTNNDPEILDDFARLLEFLFGIQKKVFRWKERCPEIRLKNLKVRSFLLAMDLPYSTARDKKIPSPLLKAPKEVVREFVRAHFECDGHIRPDCRQVDISTASKELARQLQVVLLNFGVVSRRYEDFSKKEGVSYWRVYITGEDVERFQREIGFISARKRNAQDGFDPKKNTNKDVVPYGKESLRQLKKIFVGLNEALSERVYRQTARERVSISEMTHCLEQVEDGIRKASGVLLEAKESSHPKIFWDAVELVEPSYAHTVDLTVPEKHCFFANGFLNHNTTLAYIISKEMGTKITATSGPAIERAGDLIGILTNLGEGDVLFIDEIHRLSKVVEEFLYPAMEQFQIDFVIDKGPYAKTIKFNLKQFTLIGATTRSGLLSAPLRARFGLTHHLNFYDQKDLIQILDRSARLLGIPLDPPGAEEIARRARGTPRIANRLLRRVRDYAQVKGDGKVSVEFAKKALDAQGIDTMGLDRVDRRVLEAILQHYNGGPVGLEALAATLNEEVDTLVDVVEPYLLKAGFLRRTPRGREATLAAREHLGLTPKSWL